MSIPIDRKIQTLIICCLIFMGSLVVADFTSVKLVEFMLFDQGLLIPMGTFAFAATFLSTDIISELFDRVHAVFIVWFGVVLRFLLMLYIYWSIGDDNGQVALFSMPVFWSSEQQSHYEFVFSASIMIFIAGFVAIIVSSLLDVYVFHYLKEKHKGKNLFWLRNNVSTLFGQLINSTLFIAIAFASILSIKEIILAISGQLLIKWIIAFFVDTPLAYTFRNYGNGNKQWYAIWKIEFWKG
uniref:Probable queuosine precursor transporter n=1 Tax=Candidatus Kentrum sp. LFY TaxID=2126342 RepID=A0A450WHP4_9GAMM|nr:MAG: hypothetical protein BECKLFY1418C_GA0070996_102423 [Candidatus Kentron sp. LFY]